MLGAVACFAVNRFHAGGHNAALHTHIVGMTRCVLPACAKNTARPNGFNRLPLGVSLPASAPEISHCDMLCKVPRCFACFTCFRHLIQAALWFYKLRLSIHKCWTVAICFAKEIELVEFVRQMAMYKYPLGCKRFNNGNVNRLIDSDDLQSLSAKMIVWLMHVINDRHLDTIASEMHHIAFTLI